MVVYERQGLHRHTLQVVHTYGKVNLFFSILTNQLLWKESWANILVRYRKFWDGHIARLFHLVEISFRTRVPRDQPLNLPATPRNASSVKKISARLHPHVCYAAAAYGTKAEQRLSVSLNCLSLTFGWRCRRVTVRNERILQLFTNGARPIFYRVNLNETAFMTSSQTDAAIAVSVSLEH